MKYSRHKANILEGNMKTILEFNNTSEDDKITLQRIHKVNAMARVLREWAEKVRYYKKYAVRDMVHNDDIHKDFYKICNEWEIDPWEL